MEAILICYLGNLMAGLLKMDSVRRKFKLANVPFVYKKYFSEEWILILVGFMFPICCYFFMPELSKKINFLNEFQMLGFFTLGAGSTWLPLHWFSTSEKLIKKVIDEKTNISDQVKPSQEVFQEVKK